MIHKNLSAIIPQLTSHNVGLKRVLVCNDETESAITQIAVTTLRAGEETDRHKHESMEEYFLFVKGKATLTVEDKELNCAKGDFVAVRRGEAHQLKAIDDTELITIGCSTENGKE